MERDGFRERGFFEKRDTRFRIFGSRTMREKQAVADVTLTF